MSVALALSRDEDMTAADVGRFLEVTPEELDRLIELEALPPPRRVFGLELFRRSDVAELRRQGVRRILRDLDRKRG